MSPSDPQVIILLRNQFKLKQGIQGHFLYMVPAIQGKTNVCVPFVVGISDGFCFDSHFQYFLRNKLKKLGLELLKRQLKARRNSVDNCVAKCNGLC